MLSLYSQDLDCLDTIYSKKDVDTLFFLLVLETFFQSVGVAAFAVIRIIRAEEVRIDDRFSPSPSVIEDHVTCRGAILKPEC